MMKSCIVALVWALAGSGVLGASSNREGYTNNDNGIQTIYKRIELGEISLTVGPTSEAVSEHDARAIGNIASDLVESFLGAKEPRIPIRRLEYYRLLGPQTETWIPLNRRALSERELSNGGYTTITFPGAVAQYSVISDRVQVPTAEELLDDMGSALFPQTSDGGLVNELKKDSRFSSITSADYSYKTAQPTQKPSPNPTSEPTLHHSSVPSLASSHAPSTQPSLAPSRAPSTRPSISTYTLQSAPPSSKSFDEPLINPVPRLGVNAARESDVISGGGGNSSSPVMVAAGTSVAVLVIAVAFVWKRRRDKENRPSSVSDTDDPNPSRRTKKRLHLHARDHLNKTTDADNDEEATDDDASDTFSVVLAKAAAAACSPKTVALTDNDDDTDMLSSTYSPNTRTPTGLSFHSAESFENDRAMTFVLSKDMLYANNATSPPQHNKYNNAQNILSPSHFIASDNASLASDKASDFVNLEFEPDAHWDPDDNDKDDVTASSQIFQQSSDLELGEQVTIGERIGSIIDKFRHPSNAQQQSSSMKQHHANNNNTGDQFSGEGRKRTKSHSASPGTPNNTASTYRMENVQSSRQLDTTSSADETDSEGGHFV